MSKIMLFMRGDLTSKFTRAPSLMFGEQKDVEAYGLGLGCDVDGLGERIKTSIVDSADRGQEVLVLIDPMNGTPFNSIMQLEEGCSFRHFMEVNFPLLLEVLNRRMSQDLVSAIVGLDEMARGSIHDYDAFLSQVAL